MDVKDIPKDVSAEQALLGAALLDPEKVIPEIEEKVSAEHFYQHGHQLICRAIFDLFDHGHPADIVSVTRWLDDHGMLDKAGGGLYLTSLLDRVTTPEAASYYADIVRDKAAQRELILAGQRIIELGYKSGEDVESLKSKALDEISHVVMDGGGGQVLHVSEAVDGLMEKIKIVRGGQSVNLTTGFPSLDKIIYGVEGKLVVIAGYTSMGKSVLMQNMALRQAKKGIPVAIISLEMTTEAIMKRLAQAEGHMTRHDLVYQSLDKVRSVLMRLAVLPIWLVSPRGDSLVQVLRQMKQAIVRHEVKVIYVDYLQKIRATSGHKRWEQLGEITRELSSFAREHSVGVVTGSQVKRESPQEGKGPQLWHMRESADIEQDSDVIIGIYRKKDALIGMGEEMTVEILKNREGMAGEKIKLMFFADEQRIEEPVLTSAH